MVKIKLNFKIKKIKHINKINSNNLSKWKDSFQTFISRIDNHLVGGYPRFK